METMRANVFHGKENINVEEVEKPGVGEAIIKVTLTTICGTDLHMGRDRFLRRPSWYGLGCCCKMAGTSYRKLLTCSQTNSLRYTALHRANTLGRLEDF